MPEMGVDDDPEALEIVEVPVDRRDVHLGRDGLDLGAQLLGGAVAPGIEQGPQQQDPRARDPAPAFPEQRQRASTESTPAMPPRAGKNSWSQAHGTPGP